MGKSLMVVVGPPEANPTPLPGTMEWERCKWTGSLGHVLGWLPFEPEPEPQVVYRITHQDVVNLPATPTKAMLAAVMFACADMPTGSYEDNEKIVIRAWETMLAAWWKERT